jgi:Cdc6-like AAA superfamily ATPase
MDDTIATASLQWLSEEDPSTDPARVQQRLSAKRQPDSGTWLLNSSKFKQWLADEQQILLLVGPPGAGKSVLSSLVVDTLIETFEASSRKHTVYLYCGYNQGQGPDQLCRSILLQLARRSTLTKTHIEDLSQSFEQDLSTLSASQLFGLLTQIITPGSKVYIVLDGWDALSNSTRRVFLAHLFELRETHLISLFFTSRVRPDATKPFSGYPSLGFDRAIVNGDIEKYIMERQWVWPLQTNRRFIFELSRAIVKTSGGS